MDFNQSLLDKGLAPLLSQERLDTLCGQAIISPDLRAVVGKWVAKIRDAEGRGETLKESEHERDFVIDIFQTGLGYRGSSLTGALTLRAQFNTAAAALGIKGKPMDAALGHFASSGAGTGGSVAVVVEAKGTDCDLDKNRNSNNQTAPEQAFGYAATCREGTPSFVIVTNLKEIRLYRFQQRVTRFWRLDLSKHGISLNDEQEKNLRELAFLLAPEQLLPDGNLKARLDLLLDVTEEAPPSLAVAIHKEIEKVIEGFQQVILTAKGAPKDPTEADRDSAWQGGQRLVSRMLFAGFANKHALLEPMLLNMCKGYTHPLNRIAKWDGLQHLFRAMDSGFIKNQRVLVPHFNGGLFRHAPWLDDLKPKPGPLLDDSIDNAFALAYTADLDSGSTLMGHIFEQGLKRFEARTLKQVQDGIVYTPEYICRAVTVQTLAPLVKAAFQKADALLAAEGMKDGDPLFVFHRFQRHWNALASLRIIDPACGSGAFLAAALHYLKFIAMDEDALKVRAAYADLPEPPQVVNGTGSLLAAMEGQGEMDPTSERGHALSILASRKPMEKAIFGRDLHAEAVSYAQLAVWIKGVERADIIQQIGERMDPDAAVLASLDDQIVTGNSLVSISEWKAQFPAVFDAGGFDAVLANPPYVKIQDLRDPSAKTEISALFPEVAKGSYDLCTPFIHLGLRDLLAPQGRMGIIAPTPWSLVDHGEGLRRVVATGQHLEGVVHFRDYQVFEAVMTYTALWFFTATPNVTGVWLLDAPGGIRSKVDAAPYTPIHDGSALTATERVIPWSELPVQVAGGRETFWPIWASADLAIRNVVQVQTKSKNLEDYLAWDTTKGGAFQGIVTGMNDFFHVVEFPRGAVGNYKSKLEPKPFSIEPHIVRHLIDADCVDRYTIKDSGARAIFPYVRTTAGDWILIDLASFPQFKAYAKRHWAARDKTKTTPKFQGLENREGGKHRVSWWGYSGKKNLEKQSLTKLVYPTTVKRLAFALDTIGRLQDDKRVYGLATGTEDEGFFLLGVLNASLANWFAKRISPPKSGGYFEPIDFCIRKLPIPILGTVDHQAVIDHAKRRHEISEELAKLNPTAPSAANTRAVLENEAGQKERAIDAIIKGHYHLTDVQWEQILNG